MGCYPLLDSNKQWIGSILTWDALNDFNLLNEFESCGSAWHGAQYQNYFCSGTPKNLDMLPPEEIPKFSFPARAVKLGHPQAWWFLYTNIDHLEISLGPMYGRTNPQRFTAVVLHGRGAVQHGLVACNKAIAACAKSILARPVVARMDDMGDCTIRIPGYTVQYY